MSMFANIVALWDTFWPLNNIVEVISNVDKTKIVDVSCDFGEDICFVIEPNCMSPMPILVTGEQ